MQWFRAYVPIVTGSYTGTFGITNIGIHATHSQCMGLLQNPRSNALHDPCWSAGYLRRRKRLLMAVSGRSLRSSQTVRYGLKTASQKDRFRRAFHVDTAAFNLPSIPRLQHAPNDLTESADQTKAAYTSYSQVNYRISGLSFNLA